MTDGLPRWKLDDNEMKLLKMENDIYDLRSRTVNRRTEQNKPPAKRRKISEPKPDANDIKCSSFEKLIELNDYLERCATNYIDNFDFETNDLVYIVKTELTDHNYNQQPSDIDSVDNQPRNQMCLRSNSTKYLPRLIKKIKQNIYDTGLYFGIKKSGNVEPHPFKKNIRDDCRLFDFSCDPYSCTRTTVTGSENQGDDFDEVIRIGSNGEYQVVSDVKETRMAKDRIEPIVSVDTPPEIISAEEHYHPPDPPDPPDPPQPRNDYQDDTDFRSTIEIVDELLLTTNCPIESDIIPEGNHMDCDPPSININNEDNSSVRNEPMEIELSDLQTTNGDPIRMSSIDDDNIDIDSFLADQLRLWNFDDIEQVYNVITTINEIDLQPLDLSIRTIEDNQNVGNNEPKKHDFNMLNDLNGESDKYKCIRSYTPKKTKRKLDNLQENIILPNPLKNQSNVRIIRNSEFYKPLRPDDNFLIDDNTPFYLFNKIRHYGPLCHKQSTLKELRDKCKFMDRLTCTEFNRPSTGYLNHFRI